MLKAFFFLSRGVVAHKVLVSAENACGFHCSSTLWTENALDLDATSHVEGETIVTDPVCFWDFVDSVATLVNGDIASSTKHDQVLIFVVAIVADSALSVLLNH